MASRLREFGEAPLVSDQEALRWAMLLHDLFIDAGYVSESKRLIPEQASVAEIMDLYDSTCTEVKEALRRAQPRVF